MGDTDMGWDHMNFRRTIATAALAAAVTVAGTGIAQAHPGAPASPGVSYRAQLVDKTVVTTIENGAFAVAGDTVAIRDLAGATVASLPLSYELGGQRHPVRHDVSRDGRTLRLTPDTAGVSARSAQAIASPLENQYAQQDFLGTLGVGTTVGSLVGLAIGAAGGVVLGLATCFVLTVGCIVTILPIVATAAAVGGIVGTIVAGGPTLIGAGWKYINTLNAAPGQSPYADMLKIK